MQQLQFKTTIAAPREAVWIALWNDANYREWTSVFSPGSTVETDWKKGSKVLFLDGNGSGMYSRIEDVRENEYMSFRHLGEIKNGVEQPESTQWDGTENYTLQNVDGKTELTVDLQFGNAGKDYSDYFNNTFPKALEKLKAIAENLNVTA